MMWIGWLELICTAQHTKEDIDEPVVYPAATITKKGDSIILELVLMLRSHTTLIIIGSLSYTTLYSRW